MQKIGHNIKLIYNLIWTNYNIEKKLAENIMMKILILSFIIWCQIHMETNADTITNMCVARPQRVNVAGDTFFLTW